MKRKLVKQGAATMMISLPSKWIRENKLEKGDEIEVSEQEGNLIIGRAAKSKGEITLSLDGDNRKDIFNILSHAYRNGYDKILVKNTDKEAVKQIKTITESDLHYYFSN